MNMQTEKKENGDVVDNNGNADKIIMLEVIPVLLCQCIESRKRKEELEEKVRIEEISIADDEKILAAKEEDVKTFKIGINTNKAILKENKNQCDICRKDEEKLRKQIHDYYNKGHDLLDKLSYGEKIDIVNIIKILEESKTYIYPINKIEEKNGILLIPEEDVIENNVEEFQQCVKPSRQEYETALLEILYDSPGGKAELQTDIYRRIECKFNLCPLEYGPVPSGTEKIKWQNTVRQVRRDLVNRGDIKESVVSGEYEISEKGRRFVEDHIRNKNRSK